MGRLNFTRNLCYIEVHFFIGPLMITLPHRPVAIITNYVVQEYLDNPNAKGPLEGAEVDLYDALVWACANNDLGLIARLEQSPTPWLFDKDMPLSLAFRAGSVDAINAILPHFKNNCCESVLTAIYTPLRNTFSEKMILNLNLDLENESVFSDLFAKLSSAELEKHSNILSEKIATHTEPSIHVMELFNWLATISLEISQWQWVFDRVTFSSKQWESIISKAVEHQKWDLVECMKRNAPHPLHIGNPAYYENAFTRYDLDEIEKVRDVVDFTKYRPEDAKSLINSIISRKRRFVLMDWIDAKNAKRRFDVVKPLLICLSSEDRKTYIAKMAAELNQQCMDELLATYPEVRKKDLFPDLLDAGGYMIRLYFDEREWSEDDVIEWNARQVELFDFYSWPVERLRHPKIATACSTEKNPALIKRILHHGAKLTLNDVLNILSWPEKNLDTEFVTLCIKNCSIDVSKMKGISDEQWAVLSSSSFGCLISRLLPLHENMSVNQQKEFFAAAIRSNNTELVKIWKKNIELSPDHTFLQIAATVSWEMVEELLDVSDPYNNNSEALLVAVKHGKVEVVKNLIPLCNPQGNKSIALRKACMEKNVEMVKLLLPVSSPRDEQCSALQIALEVGNDEIVQLLLPYSNIALVRQIGDGENRDYLEEQVAVFEKSKLLHELDAQPSSIKSRRVI